MAGSVNKCILIGHLGADPEVRTMQGGGKVVNSRAMRRHATKWVIGLRPSIFDSAYRSVNVAPLRLS